MSAMAPMSILIVDDDAGHCELVRRHLRRAGISNDVKMIHNGNEALVYLTALGSDGRRADEGNLLVLLDINMPGGMSGIDVLRELRPSACGRTVPVIMLTTTDDPREIRRCYELGCNVYVTKPVELSQFLDALNRLGLFLSVVRMPGQAALGPADG